MEITMPDLEKVRERLKALSEAQVKALTRLADVPYSTVQKIRYDKTQNPGFLTVQALCSNLELAEASDKGAMRKRVTLKRTASRRAKAAGR